MKRIALALGALSIFSATYAQETPKPAEPVPGENSFTEAQPKERIQDKGYTDVTPLTKGEYGIWSASAMKDGKAFEVKLDYQGNITKAAK